ncbi:DUF4012 domain-containing protein [Candidatus Daviesbacteria bacterium]|nr:DUF4012 domain-containing protein [Candidatus Daviesbacteria bacterium]
MGDYIESINKKTIISLARNVPSALVVGAAGFLGSHLVDRLLGLGIQVIGVDNLSSGDKKNLSGAVKNRNFHLLIEDAKDLSIEVVRLDYVFITAGQGWDLDNLLKIIRDKDTKCLFVSKVELYDEERAKDFEWFKKSEVKIARYASEKGLNVRVLRLGTVFGPRMNFHTKDPIVKLIQAALNNQLQKDVSLEFSTRALYIMDACDLLIKAVLSGATALKIFDGVLPTPIKVAEIKQVLLDPVWYETKNFAPSELPPWPTPNLVRTMKFLSWHPRANIVEQLKKTLTFFKDNEITVPKIDREEKEMVGAQTWKEEKSKEIRGFKKEVLETKQTIKKIRFSWGRIVAAGVILLVFFALVFPVIEIGFGIATFRFQLADALNNLGKGEFEKSKSSLEAAQKGVLGAKSVFDSFEPIRRTGQFKKVFELGDNLYNLASLSLSSSKSTVAGIQALYGGVLAVTGESNEAPNDYFLLAQSQLTSAFEDLSKVELLLSNPDFGRSIPQILQGRLNSLKMRLALYSKLVEKGRAASVLLPEIVALDGSKNYLVLLQNNNELRPTGGFIGSFAKISFAGGKLKNIDVNDIYAIDGQLNIHVEPPQDIKNDLGQKDWYLRDSNWESDFPSSAKQAEWFFTKETGEKVLGVVAVDVSAIEKLLQATGPLDIADYDEKITADNLFERAITHAETSFFAGSQAKKNFLTALTNTLFNKIFFSKNPNWPGIVKALGDSLETKHMSIFLDDPKLFSYLVAQNWAGVLPREIQQDGVFDDFIAPVEANLGANKANYYLDRSYNLETVIGKEGEIKHRLRITYINNSPSDTWPAGKYKNRLRIYLPFGSKLTRVLWGETNITKETSAFVDYGRSAFSMLLEVLPKQQRILVFDYEAPRKLQFKQNAATYKLNVVKQAGTLKDPFIWRVSFPINYSLASEQTKKLGPQEQTIQTDLSTDRSFEVEFKK